MESDHVFAIAGDAELDAVIVGSGPCAAALAIHLRRGGSTVATVSARQGEVQRPSEVITSQTVREIESLGLSRALNGARVCRGLLTNWDGGDSFYDYGLLQCGSALMLDPGRFRRQLNAIATQSGACVVHSLAWTAKRLNDGKWELTAETLEGRVRLRCRSLFLAHGRSAPRRKMFSVRHFVDKQVALEVAVRRSGFQDDCLLIEASENGWWYAPPRLGNSESIVFLTDYDLLPRGRDVRDAFVSSELRSTTLMSRCLENGSDSIVIRGCDARFSVTSATPYEDCFAAGDAVLALDPLSGSGIAFALESARRCVREAGLKSSDDRGAYEAWVANQARDEAAKRINTYSRAFFAGARTAYWDRRSAAASA